MYLCRWTNDQQGDPQAQKTDERPECDEKVCIVAARSCDTGPQFGIAQCAQCRQNTASGPYQQRHSHRSAAIRILFIEAYARAQTQRDAHA